MKSEILALEPTTIILVGEYHDVTNSLLSFHGCLCEKGP
jgi:hypothetical protein